MTEVSAKTIDQLAHLTRLELSEEEKGRYAKQLSAVVGYIDQLSKVDTENVAVKGVSGLENVLALDQARTQDDLCAVESEALLAGAPVHEEGFILVRAVMGEEVVSA